MGITSSTWRLRTASSAEKAVLRSFGFGGCGQMPQVIISDTPTHTYIHSKALVQCDIVSYRLLFPVLSRIFACMNVYILVCSRTGRLSAAEDAAHVEGGAKIVQHEHHRILSTATATIPAFLVQTVGLDHSSLGSGWRQLA